MPKLSYLKRRTVDKLLNSLGNGYQYEMLWLHISQRELVTCIKILLSPKKLIKNKYGKEVT